MTDLFDPETVADFRGAIRDVTDTFHKTPVTLRRSSGEEIALLAGVKPADTGNDGDTNGELDVREERAESVERWVVSFNRDYLQEKGLVDTETDQLLITHDDWIIYKGKRFSIEQLTDKALFRGVPILAQLTVAR